MAITSAPPAASRISRTFSRIAERSTSARVGYLMVLQCAPIPSVSTPPAQLTPHFPRVRPLGEVPTGRPRRSDVSTGRPRRSRETAQGCGEGGQDVLGGDRGRGESRIGGGG